MGSNSEKSAENTSGNIYIVKNHMPCPGVGYGQKVEDHMGLRKGSSGEDDFIVITRRVQGREFCPWQ